MTTAISMQVDISLPPIALSPNSGTHFMRKSGHTKRHRREASLAFRSMMGSLSRVGVPWAGDRPVEVFIEYRHSRDAHGYKARDEQNAIAALKAAFDGMVDAGVVPGDTKKWVSVGGVSLLTTAKSHPGRGDGVTLTVRVK